MNARQMFKDIPVQGKVLRCSKGGYDYGLNTFAYRICDDGKQYRVTVLSDVLPREYSVPYSGETTLETLENAVLYNEWRARVMKVKQEKEKKL